MRCDSKDLMLYAVTDRAWLGGHTLAFQVEQALKGGVTMVQLREKNPDEVHILEDARQIQQLCRQYRVPFIINDHVELMQQIQADGIHVGQEDMEAGLVRSKIGPDKILGVSVQTVGQAVMAEAAGADYLGVGAVFSTTMKDDAQHVSYQTLKNICQAVQIPIVAIGGIGEHNLTQLSGSGICGIAVISAIFSQPDIEKAAAALKISAQHMLMKP